MKKYRIRLIDPVWGVPVTFIEHYVPPLADRGIGSEYIDSEKEQMTKTSELTDNITICDTLSPLAYNKNLRSRERERERVLLPNTYSGSSDMNTTWATEQISGSLKSTATVYTRGFSSAVFDLVGITEENGAGLSNGLREPFAPPHGYVNGIRKYTRLFIRLSASAQAT